MLFFLILITAILLITMWSCYMVIFRFDRSKQKFALIHFLLQSALGSFTAMGIFFLAIGSTGHYVESDFERVGSNIFFLVGFISLGVSFIGAITAAVRGILQWRSNNK